MIDRHAVHALLDAGTRSGEIAKQLGVSVRTIQRIAKEPRVESADDGAARKERGIGRPGVSERVRERLRALIAEDPEAPPLEYLRVLRDESVRLGDSTFYRIFRHEQKKLPTEIMVRFEGVAGNRLPNRRGLIQSTARVRQSLERNRDMF